MTLPRKITQKAVRALLNGGTFRSGNTVVGNGVLSLHGSKIVKVEDGAVWIRTGGYETQTTKERLNGVPGVQIYQQRGQWYLNGEAWADTSAWTRI